MIGFLLEKLHAWILMIHETYHVHAVVFLVISTVNAPFFYYTMFRLVKAAARRETARLPLWAALFLVSVVVPYLYVLFWGRNLPWYIYAAMGLLVAQGVWTLARKLRRRSRARGAPPAGPEERR